MKPNYLISLTMIFSAVPILILFWGYYIKHIDTAFDFTREFTQQVQSFETRDLGVDSYYIAGSHSQNIYLGNITAPFHLLKLSSELVDAQKIKLNINDSDYKKSGRYRVAVACGNYYLLNGYSRSVLSGKIGHWNADVNAVYTPYFSQVAILNDRSMIFRMVDLKSNTNVLRKQLTNVRDGLQNNKLLEKQVDGLFCTDGILKYNKHLNLLTYMYYYRNEILLIDTNLKLISKMRTIDPIDTARFKVSVTDKKRSTFSTLPLLVNANYDMWEKYLFVQSKLRSRNEDLTQFKNSTVIDIYDLKKLAYCYSIHLPLHKGNQITDFKVFNGYLVTVSGSYLSMYKYTLAENVK